MISIFKVKPIVQSLLKPISTFFYPYKTQVLLFFFVVFGLQTTIAQEENFIIPDSLLKLSYDELEKRFYEGYYASKEKVLPFANTYLKKGRKDRNQIKIAIGYSLIGYTYGFETKKEYDKRLAYLDSAIYACKGINHEQYPLLFYINKSVVHYRFGNYQKALNGYIYSHELAKKKESKFYEIIATNNIAIIKRKFGKYEEAKLMFQECVDYEYERLRKGVKDPSAYLYELSQLITTYRLNGQIDSAHILNRQGYKLAKDTVAKRLFAFNEGVFLYYEKKYKKAIEQIKTFFPNEKKLKFLFEDYSVINAYLFLGMSYEALSQNEIAIQYYQKIDSIAGEADLIISETRWAYNKLIDHYKTVGDKNQQLFYTNRLLHADSIADASYKSLNETLKKDYDIPQLLVEKEALITDLEAKDDQSSKVILGLSLFSLVLGGFLFWNYHKRKAYGQRFELLMNQTKEEEQKPMQEPSKDSDIGISESIVTEILQKLNDFEQQQGYLKNSLTLNSLAKELKTNANYLSKIVNANKHKSFSHYINDLRIEYVVTQLKSNPTFRKYTVKAIANEIGFKSPDAFSKAFYKSTGIYPSYFIKQLEKQENVAP